MGLEDLTQDVIIQNVLSIISTSIYIIIGIIIIAKYIKNKQKVLLTAGFLVIFMTCSRWCTNIIFILFILFDFDIPTVLFLFFAFGFLPLLVVFGYYSWCFLLYPKWYKRITLITIVTGILYVIFFVIFLFTIPSLIGERVAKFDLIAGFYVLSYILITALFATGIVTHMLIQSLRSEKEKTRWKAKFVMIAWITFIVGSIFDAAFALNIILLFIAKIIFISSAILNYIGWIMPEKVLKWLTKKKE